MGDVSITDSEALRAEYSEQLEARLQQIRQLREALAASEALTVARQAELDQVRSQLSASNDSVTFLRNELTAVHNTITFRATSRARSLYRTLRTKRSQAFGGNR